MASRAEHSEEQRAAFKGAYANRLRRQLVVIVLLVAVMTRLALIEDGSTYFGVSGAVLGPISFVALSIGWVVFHGRNWRCPACDESLGRAFNPKHCRRCGIELRG